jgi:hypothetical protein
MLVTWEPCYFPAAWPMLCTAVRIYSCWLHAPRHTYTQNSVKTETWDTARYTKTSCLLMAPLDILLEHGPGDYQPEADGNNRWKYPTEFPLTSHFIWRLYHVWPRFLSATVKSPYGQVQYIFMSSHIIPNILTTECYERKKIFNSSGYKHFNILWKHDIQNIFFDIVRVLIILIMLSTYFSNSTVFIDIKLFHFKS